MEYEKIICKMYQSSSPTKDIAAHLGISQRTVARHINKLKSEGKLDKKKRKTWTKMDEKIGEKFSHLTVVGVGTRLKSGYKLRCICECGRATESTYQQLKIGRKKTCAHKDCIHHRQDYTNNGKNNSKFTGYEEISGMKWAGIKAGAARRGLRFKISIKDAWNQYLKQNKQCAITKLDIGFGRTNSQSSSASLDRIDSKKGYTKENIQWVHKDINIMKWDFEMDHFKQLCQLVIENSP